LSKVRARKSGCYDARPAVSMCFIKLRICMRVVADRGIGGCVVNKCLGIGGSVWDYRAVISEKRRCSDAGRQVQRSCTRKMATQAPRSFPPPADKHPSYPTAHLCGNSPSAILHMRSWNLTAQWQVTIPWSTSNRTYTRHTRTLSVRAHPPHTHARPPHKFTTRA
jgi:hypothetical protein